MELHLQTNPGTNLSCTNMKCTIAPYVLRGLATIFSLSEYRRKYNFSTVHFEDCIVFCHQTGRIKEEKK